MLALLKGWLGIGALEFMLERQEQAIATLRTALATEVRERSEDWLKHQDELVALNKRLDAPITSEVRHPIACPHCSREGLVRISAIEAIDRADPQLSRPIGFGLYCPHRGCRKSFYWEATEDGNGKTWSTDEALDDDSRRTADATDAGSKPAAATPRAPAVRWRPRGIR